MADKVQGIGLVERFEKEFHYPRISAFLKAEEARLQQERPDYDEAWCKIHEYAKQNNISMENGLITTGCHIALKALKITKGEKHD